MEWEVFRQLSYDFFIKAQISPSVSELCEVFGPHVWCFDLITVWQTAHWSGFLRSNCCTLFLFSTFSLNELSFKWQECVWLCCLVCSVFLKYIYLLVPQASGQVGHFSHVSPNAPGSVHWQRPHTQFPRPWHIFPSSEMQDDVSMEQLQLSPM